MEFDLQCTLLVIASQTYFVLSVFAFVWSLLYQHSNIQAPLQYKQYQLLLIPGTGLFK